MRGIKKKKRSEETPCARDYPEKIINSSRERAQIEMQISERD